MKVQFFLVLFLITVTFSRPICCENCDRPTLLSYDDEEETSSIDQAIIDAKRCANTKVCSVSCSCDLGKAVYYDIGGQNMVKSYERVCLEPKRQAVLQFIEARLGIEVKEFKKKSIKRKKKK